MPTQTPSLYIWALDSCYSYDIDTLVTLTDATNKRPHRTQYVRARAANIHRQFHCAYAACRCWKALIEYHLRSRSSPRFPILRTLNWLMTVRRVDLLELKTSIGLALSTSLCVSDHKALLTTKAISFYVTPIEYGQLFAYNRHFYIKL